MSIQYGILVSESEEMTMTQEQLQNAIDAAYDCDDAAEVARLEAQLEPEVPVTAPAHGNWDDPLGCTSRIFGVPCDCADCTTHK